ncbi:hypothetical protein C2E23DRAFT_886903 [Lenzites betulinus]|nr:hypothetical protein C2E23DRAFT_886903 [Lenzites betulinus]
MTLNRGSLSLCSILAFVFALILPGNLVYAGLSIIGTKLYANSVLAVLNSRREINNRFLDDFTLPEMPQFVSMASRATSGLHGAPSSSLAWNGPQNSACLSNRASIEQTEGAPLAESDESGPELDIHDFSKAGLRNSVNSAV